MDLPYLKERRVASLERAGQAQDSCARLAHIGLARFYSDWIERIEAALRKPGDGY